MLDPQVRNETGRERDHSPPPLSPGEGRFPRTAKGDGDRRDSPRPSRTQDPLVQPAGP